MKKFLLLSLFLAASSLQSGTAGEILLNGTKIQATLIDVRTPQEFSAGHLPSAQNIPVDRIEVDIRSIKGLNKDSPILVYCRSGRRSALAKEILEKQGFRNIRDGGGMETLSRNLKVCSAQEPC